ncbi:DUF1440 domain-containing protein [Microvirga roseola]|uniref:DUF1440 domain-containing protein n=1 Tax=Microvirga roseola TaxID=2883126 RepID=UPI001E39AE99|nr:DUF1440 domain-containing protein [Microvirga roseola]
MQATATLTSDLAKGALAGAASTWVLDRVDWMMVDYEDPKAWRRTRDVRPNHKDPAHNLVDKAAEAVGSEPIPQPNPAGIAVHYALGIGPAAFYATVRDHIPGGPLGRGILLGLGMTLIEDETLNPAMGLAAKPQRYPWQAHARSVVAHLVYGLATEAILSVLDYPRGRGRRRSHSEQEAGGRVSRDPRRT